MDLAQTNPEGFPEDRAPGRQRENIIYELHIKDFSQDAASGIPEELRGKYRAFSYLGKEGEPLCMRHLKNLGVTHIHLLPFFDFGWLDEAGSGEQFNWGYDPVNYNVPEGSYSTNPFEGSVRIRECKEMIQALHRAGFRVVMDVVYNHTHDAYSFWSGRHRDIFAAGFPMERFPTVLPVEMIWQWEEPWWIITLYSLSAIGRRNIILTDSGLI